MTEDKFGNLLSHFTDEKTEAYSSYSESEVGPELEPRFLGFQYSALPFIAQQKIF